MSWEAVQIGDVCDIVSGATPKTGNPDYWDGDVRWVTPKDLSALDKKFISDSPRTITETGLKSCAAKLLPANSLLLSSRAPIGLVAINTVPVCTNQGFKNLVPKDGRVYADYLYWWLTTHRNYLNSLGRGATFKEVSKAIVERISIPLPPLEEQKRIAAILDEADELRAKRRESLAQLDLLLQSTFLDLFGDPVINPKGWESATIEDVVAAGDRVNYGVVQPGDDVQGGAPLIRVGDFISGDLDFSKIKFIDPAIDSKYSRSKLNGTEILISCVGSIGNICKVPVEAIGHNIARAVARVPLIDSVNRDFMVQLLRTKRVQDYFIKETRTVSQPTLNISLIKSTPIFLPPLEAQTKFAEIVGQAETQWGRYHEQSAEFDNLFASLQSRAFRGEL